jgi:DtxR family Mn-dependent transcriptional regulator
MRKEKKLTASLENYLCAIYSIEKQNKAARVKDISSYLSIGASSVSEAMKVLEKKEYINYEPYGLITITQKGEELVLEKNKRHEIISHFLKDVLLVDESIISESAQKLEYGMNEEVLEKFVRFLTFMQTCSCKEPKWIKSFKYFAQHGEVQEKCHSCIQKCKENSGFKDNSNCCGMNN